MSDAPCSRHRLGIDEVDERLAEAIQDGRLREVLPELEAAGPELEPASRHRVAQASDAVLSIDAAVASEARRLEVHLSAGGIAARRSPGRAPDRPLHDVALEVARRDADRAASAVEAAGYRRLAPTRGAAWQAFRATRAGCAFVPVDRRPFRVKLSWSFPRGPIGRVLRPLAPRRADLEAVSLPSGLWPGYLLLHLLRLPIRRLARHRGEPSDLGPYLETPDALIEPLLRFAGVSEGDVLLDLGCGDGRLAITAARVFGCRARGFETDAALVARARSAAAAAGVDNRVEIHRGDATRAPFADATVVVAFLQVATVEELLPRVLARLPPGARFVVHEQERLQTRPATRRAPLISPGGITVAHRWDV